VGDRKHNIAKHSPCHPIIQYVKALYPHLLARHPFIFAPVNDQILNNLPHSGASGYTSQDDYRRIGRIPRVPAW